MANNTKYQHDIKQPFGSSTIIQRSVVFCREHFNTKGQI